MHHGIGHMVEYPPPRHQTWGPICPPSYPLPPATASGGHHWRPVQTCSLEDLPPPPPLVLTTSSLVVATETHTVGKRSSYWNAVLWWYSIQCKFNGNVCIQLI